MASFHLSHGKVLLLKPQSKTRREWRKLIVATEDVSVTVAVVTVLSDLGGILTVLFTDSIMEKVFLLSH